MITGITLPLFIHYLYTVYLRFLYILNFMFNLVLSLFSRECWTALHCWFYLLCLLIYTVFEYYTFSYFKEKISRKASGTISCLLFFMRKKCIVFASTSSRVVKYLSFQYWPKIIAPIYCSYNQAALYISVRKSHCSYLICFGAVLLGAEAHSALWPYNSYKHIFQLLITHLLHISYQTFHFLITATRQKKI